MQGYKNAENAMLMINTDFKKYNEAISSQNDPVFNLCKTFLKYIFKNETEDIRTIFYVSTFFGETLKACNNILASTAIKN